MSRTLLLLIVAAPLALTGCVTTGHFNKTNTTSVDLSAANFQVVKSNVTGSHTAIRVLGLGDSPSYAKAMQELRAAAGIEGTSRALVNVTEERHRLMLPPLYIKQTLVLSADVVEFHERGKPAGVASAPVAAPPVPSAPTMTAPATESATLNAEEALRRYATAHNLGRTSGAYDELVSLFAPNGKIVFHGTFEGELRGHDEIQQAFESHPPKESLVLLQTRLTRRGAVATYAYSSQQDIPAGKLAVRVVDGRIARLDMKIAAPQVN